MGNGGAAARAKHKRQKQRRREKLELEREQGKTSTSVSFEHAYANFEEHRLPNLALLQGGILTFAVGGMTGPIWWANHRWIGGVAFALALLFITLSVIVGEKDA